MRVASYDIVFQEIPGEVTLALNLSGCPCHCPGCHSPHLWEDTGEELNEELLDNLIERYQGLITCVAFMGGDQDPTQVARYAGHIKNTFLKGVQSILLKTAWYSGRPALPKYLTAERSNSVSALTDATAQLPFDYIKLGPYIESLGGLKSCTTNQRLYKRKEGRWEDITASFWKKNFE